jgi:hypothetical protein
MPTQPGGYRTRDGKRVPSNTTIVGKWKAADPMMWWSWNLAYEPLMQARALLKRWQAGESFNGEVASFLSLPDDTFDYKAARDKAGDAGTCCHEQVECRIHSKPFDASLYSAETLERARPAFEAFEEWAKGSKLEVVETEKALVSEKHRFGGTLDAMAIQGKLSLLDWKTSNAIYGDYLVQLAGYAILWEENYPDRPIEGGFHLCRFSKQAKPDDPVSFSHHYWSHLEAAKRQFLLFRESYDLSAELGKLAK